MPRRSRQKDKKEVQETRKDREKSAVKEGAGKDETVSLNIESETVHAVKKHKTDPSTHTSPRRSPRKQPTPQKVNPPPKKNSRQGCKNKPVVQECEASTESDDYLEDEVVQAARKDAQRQERLEEPHAGADEGDSRSSTGKVPTRDLKIPEEVEQLLAEFIEGYPIIWNPEHPEHNNSSKKEQVWQLAGKKFSLPG